MFSINTSVNVDIHGCHKVFLVDNSDHNTGESVVDVYTNLTIIVTVCNFFLVLIAVDERL